VDPGNIPGPSYRSHAFGAPDKLLAVHEQYERLGKSGAERQQAYRDLFATELDGQELAEIRETANRGWPLGGDRFKDEIERSVHCAARPPRRGRPPKRTSTIVEQRRARYQI